MVNPLAQRAVACPRWRWLPGMLTLAGYRVSDEDAETDAPTPFADDVPDLRDSATRGCVLTLVREAWDDPLMCPVGYVIEGRVRWRFDSDDHPVGDLYDCDSEAQVLVEALEQAGGRRL